MGTFKKVPKILFELDGKITLNSSVNVYYYLEDDSIHVSEPKVSDSGIPQGTLIRRHKIAKAAADGQNYTVKDFNVGLEVCFYSRTFTLVGCDGFTRVFTFH
jgi:hypothetical protein